MPRSVLIVGGGIMGVSAAWELARSGAEVTVLEKAILGAEASSAAAGIIGAEIENPEPGPLHDLCRLSRKLYPSWVQALESASQVSVGLLDGGSLEVGQSQAEFASLLRRRKRQLREGSAQRIGRQALAALEPNLAASAAGGVYFPSDRRITPAALFRATHIAAAAEGVQFRTGALVRSIALLGSASAEGACAEGVLLEDGSHLAADVTVIAAGSWTSLLAGLPAGMGPVVPARGQLVELDSPLPPLSRVVFGEGVYLVPRADGRLLIGSTLEFVGYRKGVTAGAVSMLLAGAIRLVPCLASAELRGSWSNFRPFTADHLPLLGRAGVRGLVIASGHHRNGILLAPITAKIVAALALGRRPPLPLGPFDPRRTLLGAPR